MSEVKWIKIVTDIFDDEKILLIESLPEADSVIVIWFKLLCLAGKQNNSGVFVMSNGITYTDKMLATIFRRKESTVSMALKTFKSFGMIEIIDDAYTIPNWNKHQSLDAYEKKKQRDRQYQAERRAAQKSLIKKSSDKSSDVAISDKEEDKEKDKDKDTYRKVDADKSAVRSIFISLLLSDGSEYGVTETEIKEWEELYPSVDVKQQLRMMKGWTDSNPTKRKTSKGIKRFITNWLAKSQNNSSNKQNTMPDYSYGTEGVDYL